MYKILTFEAKTYFICPSKKKDLILLIWVKYNHEYIGYFYLLIEFAVLDLFFEKWRQLLFPNNWERPISYFSKQFNS